MERLPPPQFRDWVRDPSGDRPELTFPRRARELEPFHCEQLVGFRTQEGNEVEVSRSWAIEHGLITVGMCAIARVGIEEFLEKQK